MRISLLIMLILLVNLLASCTFDDTQTYAPVVDASAIEKIPSTGVYRANQADTLYSIAWRYGLDYRSLANRNHLRLPYTVHPGQIIYLRGIAPLSPQPSAMIKSGAEWGHLERGPQGPVTYWVWPARGNIVGKFSESNKGINIAGHAGDPIYATAAGKVVYSGNGLRWYGNLIIIKHNSTFLSAYAHNSSVYVKEGDWVRAGQKIAGMGSTGARRVMLHFEIRRNGQSVNPLVYLPK